MTFEHYDMTTKDFVERLLSPERAEKLDPSVILDFCPIAADDKVADIGCGPGYFTLPLATAMPDGTVYALDIDEGMLDACKERVEEGGFTNVETLTCSEFDFPLEKGSLNGVFLAFVVQHGNAEEKLRLLQATRELLQPRGWAAVIEWFRIETETGPPLERRVDPGTLEELARQAGYQVGEWRDLNGEQYLMNLRNP